MPVTKRTHFKPLAATQKGGTSFKFQVGQPSSTKSPNRYLLPPENATYVPWKNHLSSGWSCSFSKKVCFNARTPVGSRYIYGVFTHLDPNKNQRNNHVRKIYHSTMDPTLGAYAQQVWGPPEVSKKFDVVNFMRKLNHHLLVINYWWLSNNSSPKKIYHNSKSLGRWGEERLHMGILAFRHSRTTKKPWKTFHAKKKTSRI